VSFWRMRREIAVEAWRDVSMGAPPAMFEERERGR